MGSFSPAYFLLEFFPNIMAANGAPAISASDTFLTSQTDFATDLMLAAIIFFSVVSWGIIIFKLISIRKAKKETASFLDIFWTSKNFDDIYKASEDLNTSPLTNVFRAGFDELEKIQKTKRHRQKKREEDLTHITTELDETENVSRSLKNAMNIQCVYLEKYITFLSMTSTTAPFIGLFGTVWGIMHTFKAIGVKGSFTITVVAPGIAEALVTTVAGLAAAIPAVLAYNYFFNEVKLLETEMENFSFEVLNIINRHLLIYEGKE